MASVHRPTSFKTKFWWGAWTGPDGTRYFRSTKERNKNKALEVTLTWERLARGNASEAHFRKVAADIYQDLTEKPLHFHSCGEWLAQWLKSTKNSVAAGTYEKYKSTITDFRAFLGKADEGPLAAITPAEVTAYRDKLVERGLAATTINVNVGRTINGAFEAARRLGYITVNPCSGVKPVKDDVRGAKKDIFQPEQIDALLEAAKDTSWEGMILCGLSTGLRLGDVAGLEWGQIDMRQGVLKITAQKTGGMQSIPLHENFQKWLENQTQGIGKAPVFPDLYGKKSGGCSGLSATFKKLMEKAGVVGKIIRRGVEDRENMEGNKARTGRQTSSLTFHSLRHTVTSQLANAGIEADQRKAITGHSDDRVHERYTHYKMETLKEAVKKIDVPKPKGKQRGGKRA
jgi:integrase